MNRHTRIITAKRRRDYQFTSIELVRFTFTNIKRHDAPAISRKSVVDTSCAR